MVGESSAVETGDGRGNEGPMSEEHDHPPPLNADPPPTMVVWLISLTWDGGAVEMQIRDEDLKTMTAAQLAMVYGRPAFAEMQRALAGKV